MNNLTGYCGLNCATCQLYIATINNDVSMKSEIAEKWGKLYNRTFEVGDMVCHGCKSDKKFFLSEYCDIKPCNVQRGNESCGHCCSNHSCKRIEEFHKWQKNNNTNVEMDHSGHNK